MDGASAYGRAVMRGAMQYIQVQRRWEIVSVLRGTFDVPPMPWPKCDGAIIAGVYQDLFERMAHGRQRRRLSPERPGDPCSICYSG